MKLFAKIFSYPEKRSAGLLIFILLSILSLSAQPRFVPEFRFEWGPGINISFFDIGGGSPGISFGTTVHYRWNKNFMIGNILNYHHANGSDEGTQNEKRGFDFRSNIIETTIRFSYLVSFKPLPEKRWKKYILPYLFTGTGPLVFFPNPEEHPGQAANSDYSNIALIVDGGGGLIYKYDDNWSACIELCLNIPFSDNLEGFSTQHSEHNDSYHSIFFKAVYTIPSIRKGPLKPRDFR